MREMKVLFIVSFLIMTQSFLVTPLFQVSYIFIFEKLLWLGNSRVWLRLGLLAGYLVIVMVIYRKYIFYHDMIRVEKENITIKYGILYLIFPIALTATLFTIYEDLFESTNYYYFSLLILDSKTFSKIEFNSPIYVSIILYLSWWTSRNSRDSIAST